jgi:gliding motility-associated-like protein
MKHINILEYSFRHCFRIKSPLLLRTGMLLFLVIFFFKITKAQQPKPPVIKYVTVDPFTDSVKIVWEASPFPDILTYEIYYGTDIHHRPLVAVVNSSTTSYVDYSGLSQMQSVYYSIAAIGSGFRSPFSANHRTIFLEARYDSCSATAHITWTPYIGWDSDLTSYKLYASRGGRPFEAIQTLAPADTFYQEVVDTGNQQICYYVEAINSSKRYVSSSNRACINTPMQVIPAYMDASGTVDNGSISLNFAVDPSSEITNYLLEEAPGPGGPFDSLTVFNNVRGNIQYTVPGADPAQVHYYRLSALNACGTKRFSSNLATNIVLEGSNDQDLIDLTWTPYAEWEGDMDYYELFRQIPGEAPIEINRTSTDLTFTDDLSTFKQNLLTGEVCYYVVAHEKNNPRNTNHTSQSMSWCTTLTPELNIANGFTPNNDGKNDFFGPNLLFLPDKYLFVVFDRFGNRIFETTDPSRFWDGSVNGGQKAGEGVYRYYIRLTNTQGVTVEKDGSVTVLYP